MAEGGTWMWEAPRVDIVLLTRDREPIDRRVRQALMAQQDVHIRLHRIVGTPRVTDSCRWATIARARNEGRSCGGHPWLMYVDDDVWLGENCVARLVRGLHRRPSYGALAADYLSQADPQRVAGHVAMGATLFRREVLERVRFRWQLGRCECQCCCDDLRRLHWGIGYEPKARACHLKKGRMRQS